MTLPIAATVRALTEKQWQQRVLDYAALRGWMSYHTFDSRRSTPGFPDLVLLRDRRLVFAELKTDTGRLSVAQAEWLDALLLATREVYTWRPADWPEVMETLR